MAKACTPTLLRIREAFKDMMQSLPNEKRMIASNMSIHLTGEYSDVPSFAKLLGRCLQRTVEVPKNATEAAYHGTVEVLNELKDLLPYVTSKSAK